MPQAPSKKLLDHMRDTLLLYGSGLRLMECVRRRVKENRECLSHGGLFRSSYPVAEHP